MRVILSLLSHLVPHLHRDRWREEWAAELRHGGWRMLTGALPDAWAMRRLAASQPGVRRANPLGGVGRDVSQALRGLAARPGFTLGVVLSLAVGIAATSAAFGFLRVVTLRRIAEGADPDTLVRVTINRGCGWPGCSISSSTPADYAVLAASLPSLDGLTARGSAPMAMLARGNATALRGAVVSPNYFDVLGVPPAVGRGFTPEEAESANANVAVIAHGLWQRAFGADPSVLGSFVQVNGLSVQIVGIAPPALGTTARGNMQMGGEHGIEIWLPLAFADAMLQPETLPGGRLLPTVEYELTYVGRLRADATLEHARADAAVATARIKELRGAGGADSWVHLDSASARPAGEAARLLRNLMVVPILVLLIACLNAANLLLARGSERSRDVAVRLALGASRWRVVRQLLCESFLLAIGAGLASLPAIAVLLALAGNATGFPVDLDRAALIFTAAATLLCALGFGLAPAMHAVRRTVPLGSSRTGDHAPGRMRGRRVMVGAQVALSLALLASGGQVIGAARQLLHHTGAADPNTLVLASFDLNPLKLERDAAERFYRELADRASQLGPIDSVVLARRSAFWTWGRGAGQSGIIAWGPDAGARDGKFYLGGYVAGDLTRTLGLPLIAGRNFVSSDATPVASAAIVSRAFADAIFNGSAVGRTIRVAARSQPYAAAVDVRIVGIVEAAEDRSYTRRLLPVVYVASPLEHEPALTLYVRARDGGSADIGPLLQALARELDPRIPIAEIATLATLTDRRHFEEYVMGHGLTLMGAMALALATAGLYALMSFMVSLRQREIGIRVALGADPSAILWMVASQAMRLAVIGALFGGVVAVILGGIVHANVVGAVRLDTTLLLAASCALAASMGLASIIPARRATRVDPITVLRQE